jgi:hypothetical protein
VKTFANAANLRAMLLDPECPTILQDAMPIINKAWKMNDMLRNTPEQTPSPRYNAIHARYIEDIPEIKDALNTFLSGSAPQRTIYTVREVKIGKYGFARHLVSVSQSRIFFQPVGQSCLVPGEIQDVFKFGETDTTYYLAVRRYIPPQEIHTSIFRDFPDFGATLVSENLDRLEIVCADENIRPTTSRTYGKILILIKDCTRVSSNRCCVFTSLSEHFQSI